MAYLCCAFGVRGVSADKTGLLLVGGHSDELDWSDICTLLEGCSGDLGSYKQFVREMGHKA